MASLVEFSLGNLREKKSYALYLLSLGFLHFCFINKNTVQAMGGEIITRTYWRWRVISGALNVFVMGWRDDGYMCKGNTLSQVILDDGTLIGHQNSKSDSPTGSNISGTYGVFRSLLSGSQRPTKGFIYTSPPFLSCVICHFLHHSENQLTWSSALVSPQLYFHSAPQ